MRLNQDPVTAGIDYPELDETTMHMPESEQLELLADMSGACEDTARDAYDVIALHYHTAAINLADYYLQDVHAAEDVVQEVWSNMWANRTTLDASARVWKFIEQCVMNRVRNVVRDAKVRKTDATDMSPASLEDEPIWEPSHSETPEKIALDNERKQAVRDALDTLKPEQKDLIRCVEIEGVTHKAYAEKVGVKYPTMKRRKQAAVTAMREALVATAPELYAKYVADND